MTRRFSLPMLSPAPALPTVDVMRKRLGGRAATEPGAGRAVTFTTEGGIRRTGIVLFVRGDELDVWIEENTVRRTRRSATGPIDDPLPRDLAALAADARVFGALGEGQRVRYLDRDRLGEGTLVEKCRFGALVERDDGKIIGVGFRRVWPLDIERAADQN